MWELQESKVFRLSSFEGSLKQEWNGEGLTGAFRIHVLNQLRPANPNNTWTAIEFTPWVLKT